MCNESDAILKATAAKYTIRRSDRKEINKWSDLEIIVDRFLSVCGGLCGCASSYCLFSACVNIEKSVLKVYSEGGRKII